MKDIQEVLATTSSDMTKYDAAKYLMELGKKAETFRRHVEELEEAVKDDEDEQGRFLAGYDELDEIMNQSDEIQTKLEYIEKYQCDLSKEQLLKEEKVKESENMVLVERMKSEKEHENERLRILSNEKIELEKINLEKMKLEEMSGAIVKGEGMTGFREEERLRKLTPSIKLAKLELMKFDGNIWKWQEFWDSFEAMIHKNPSLQPVDKFNYLKIHVVGEAKDVISGIDITSSNYDIAVKLLTDRYGKK